MTKVKVEEVETFEGRLVLYKAIKMFLEEYDQEFYAGFCRAIIHTISFDHPLDIDIRDLPELNAYEPRKHLAYWWAPANRKIRLRVIDRVINGKKPSLLSRMTGYRV